MSKSARRTRLYELDEEIPQLRLRLAELEQERKQIFASLKFPVLTLPVEVTSEIFIHCLPATLPDEPRTPSIVPLLLTCICRQWRNIALATPRLWSKFSILADLPNIQRHHEFIERWLSRSGNLPLSLTFRRGYPYEPENPYEEISPEVLAAHELAATDSMERCLEVFWNYSRRWQNVKFLLKPSLFQRPSISTPDGGFPRLTHITIGSYQRDESFGSEEIKLFGDAAAPQLRSVEIELDTNGDIDLRLFILPWAQLTSFTGKSFVEEECYYVLLQTPALVHCTFSLCKNGDDNAPHAHPSLAPMSYLKSLSLQASHDLSEILGALTLPSLETLSIRNHRGTNHAIPAVRQLLIRSRCDLRDFTYEGKTYDQANEFSDCLRLMPALSSLEVHWATALCAPMFERMYDDAEFVPQLQKLTITINDSGDKFPFERLLAMLQLRSEQPKPLRYLELCATTFFSRHRTSPLPDPLASGFKELIRKGVQICIGNHQLRQNWLRDPHITVFNR
ncbi:hypothetical protein C8R43DRAFT_981418 [Mycena crocata]|nr:hypothetical protein C8R43DRAFT_981418 [Mycena crocata]